MSKIVEGNKELADQLDLEIRRRVGLLPEAEEESKKK